MAESPNNPLKPPKNEMESQMRMLVVFLVVGLGLYLYQTLYNPAVPQQQPQQPAAGAAPPSQQQTPATTPAAQPQQQQQPQIAAAKPAADAPAPVQATAEETIKVDTDLYTVTLSNRGAVVKSWVLKKYQDAQDKSVELVNLSAADKVPPPFTVEFKSQKPDEDLNQALWAVKRSSDGLGIEFEYAKGTLTAKKSFQFAKASYQTGFSSQVTSSGVLLPHRLVWRGGFGDFSVLKYYGQLKNVYWNNNEGKLKSTDASDAKNGPASASGPLLFAAVNDQYFAAAYLPRNQTQFEITTYSDKLQPANETSGEEPHIGIGAGGEGLNQFDFFAGPKDLNILRRANPKLELIVDWGWFGIIAKPVFLLLRWTHDTVTHNWGWAIVVLTIAINIALLPLKYSSLKSAKKMQAIAPEVQKINDKYKGMSMRDPRKADQNQEMMDLYKRHGVNPLGGCVPMLIQLPFFFAFYTALQVTIDLRGADWLWVKDLSRPETIAIRILPIVMIATQFLMQKMTPASPGMDPAQQRMMLFMPLALGFMFYYQASGLVLYWLTGNVVGIAQQWATNRLTQGTPGIIDVKVTPVSKKKR
jgi:YidC/Oxa1 family membrane protein insertase